MTNNDSDLFTASRKVRCTEDEAAFFQLMSHYASSVSTFGVKQPPTVTERDQLATENTIRTAYTTYMAKSAEDPDCPVFHRESHIKFLLKGLRNLPSNFQCLDSSRPWICYWILHSLYLLDATRELSEELIDNIAHFLNRCQNKTGGFGGAPGQISHLATSYASINALCTLNKNRAFKVINRKALLNWIKSLKMENGAFRMHTDGEEDLRGTYCAITIAKLLNLEKLDPTLFENVAEWVVGCQTYEGGFGATPENEAHGGYSFCGLASLKLLGKENLCDIDCLLRWLVQKQMKFEGGFQGRTNKLVDSCYSFWQAGQFPIIHSILVKDSEYLKNEKNWMFDQFSLQEYILICCQNPNGGLVDKPEKNRDYYHTCYGLSGLSVSQYFLDYEINISPTSESLINRTHALFNVGLDAVQGAFAYFSTKENKNGHSKDEQESLIEEID